ncbi:MAG TPA: dihydrolipoamide acetyltransferase family protein [Acidimicrobiales bacterium]
MADIQMPQLGETVTEGTITKWFKQVGEQIAEDEPLFEVSTDKVDSEVPSPVSGVISEILVPEGETVEVGAVLARVGDGAAAGGGAAAEAPAPPAEEAAEAPARPAAEAPAPPAEEAPAEEAPAEAAAPEAAAEAPARPAAEAPPAPSESAGPVRPQTPAPAAEHPAPGPAEAPAEAPAARPNGEAPSGAKLLSPVVRRLIGEHDLDPAHIHGTGPGGRITRNDVLAVIDQRAGAPAARGPEAPPAEAPAEALPAARAPAPEAPAAAPPATRAPAPAIVQPGERDTVIPHTNIRRRTAEHMLRSKQVSAHVYASIEVDFEAVDRVRRGAREQWRETEGFSLTYLPFIARATIDAIRQYPEVNASLGQDELIVHNYVNLAVAVDLEFKGLVAPVIHDAEGKRLRALAREVADLARRARSRQLAPDDIAGGTFTITNPGPFGTTMTLPIINQPQVAILSTDAVKRRPVVVELPDGSEGIAVHGTGNITLTWNHMAFDGAYAAAFLATVKEVLETRDWAAELA